MATVLDPAAFAAAASVDTGCIPATCRIGLLGLGTVGSAVARLTREASLHLFSRGFAPIVSTCLLYTSPSPRD